jgi:hypothetical protein
VLFVVGLVFLPVNKTSVFAYGIKQRVVLYSIITNEESTMQIKIKTEHGMITVDDADIVCKSEHYDIYEGTRAAIEPGYKPDNTVRCFAIHNEYGCIAVVFACNEDQALDDAVDAGKLDSCQIPESEVTSNDDGDFDDCGGNLTRLGNAGECFNMDGISMVEIPVPKFSLAGLLLAAAVDAEPNEYSVFTYYKAFGGFECS